MWTELIPILRTALNNIASETVTDWAVCVTMGIESRDPNRYHWLLEFLLDNPLNEQTSFISFARLVMLRSVLHRQAWRNVELYNRLLLCFQKCMTQPFQNVREKISSCLAGIFSNDLVYPSDQVENFPRISVFFDQIMPQLNKLYDDTLKKLEHSNDATNDVNQTTQQMHIISLNDGEKDSSIRLFKISK